MKLLIVEDEKMTANSLKRGLMEEGFVVDMVHNGEDADEAVALYAYDVIVLDVMLPRIDGFTLCQQWRKQNIATPILFLTARDDLADRVQGLNLGGDDYLVKPFAFEELLARIRALLRRQPHSWVPAQVEIGDISIDTVRRRVLRKRRLIPLTAREYQLLEYMALHPDQLITRTELWEHVWESGNEPDSNVIEVYIRYLRNKLGRDINLIETVRGMGYILVRTPTVLEEGEA